MKAPDKKYPLSVVADLLASTPSSEVLFMPDKIYFDGVDTSTTPRLAINVEYIRKDALLELLREKRKAITECSATKERKVAALSVIDFLIDKINSL